MSQKELSEGLVNIAQRIVQTPKKWDDNEAAWLSILGTRVQMGQTTFSIASKVVAHSYANLVGVTDVNNETTKSAQICFMPDPVCARLAMCLMCDTWSMNVNGSERLEGKEKRWWSQRVVDLYSRNICSPEKGDLGEVMVALYFLFCADTLRSQISKDMTTFSVPLNDLIECLVSGSEIQQACGKEHGTVKRARCDKKTKPTEQAISFSAIQVCRNYVRAYEDTWASLQNETFLEHLYTSGIGFYLFEGCKVIDMVFSLRRGPTPYRYIPLFISVKSHVYFGPAAAQKECKAMEARVEQNDRGALCILVVFGSGSTSNDGEYSLSPSCLERLLNNEIVSMVLRIPTDDDFELSRAFLRLTTFQQEMSEILASHSFLGAHRQAYRDSVADKEAFSKKVLRLRPKVHRDSDERQTDAMTKTKDDLLSELDKIIDNGLKKGRDAETGKSTQ